MKVLLTLLSLDSNFIQIFLREEELCAQVQACKPRESV